MTTHNFSIREAFGTAWAKTKEHAWYLFCVFLVSGIILGAIGHVPLLSGVVGIFLGVAILTVALMIVAGKTPTFADLFINLKSYKVVLNYLLASILCAVIVILGLILFILPGIYLAVRLQFYKFLIVEHGNLRVTESLKRSYEMTKDHFWKLFGFMILIVIFNIIGALLLGIGLLVTLPVTVLAYTIIYKKLEAHSH